MNSNLAVRSGAAIAWFCFAGACVAQPYAGPNASFGPGSSVPLGNSQPPGAAQNCVPHVLGGCVPVSLSAAAQPPNAGPMSSFGPGSSVLSNNSNPGVAVPCAPFALGGCMPVPEGRAVEPGSALARALVCPAGMSVSISSAYVATCVPAASPGPVFGPGTTPAPQPVYQTPMSSFGPGSSVPSNNPNPGVAVPCAPFALGGCMPVPQGRAVEPGSALAKALICPAGMSVRINSAYVATCASAPLPGPVFGPGAVPVTTGAKSGQAASLPRR